MNEFKKENAYDYENGFIMTSDVFRMGNILSHYELYKKIIGLPGDVVELGVFKGSSLIQFGTFRELLENRNARKLIGFDIFDRFPNTSELAGDIQFIKEWNEETGDSFFSKEDIEEVLDMKGISNYELIKGNILLTIDDYLSRNPHLKIALLHIDCDVYEPSKIGLEKLYDRVVRGGIIIFDDYGVVEGETKAVDEFLDEKKEYQLQRLSLSHMKPTYLIKQ